jgi:hypothetical protein
VLPSELGQPAIAPPSVMPVIPGASTGVPALHPASTVNLILWKSSTALFALLWLLTLFFYLRRRAAVTLSSAPNGSSTADEKELLKQFQTACKQGNASAARKDLAQWIRNYAPQDLRGNMRDFGTACGEDSLKTAIAELDACGFALESAHVWHGEPLWVAFKRWQNNAGRSNKVEIGVKPELYPN